MQHVCVSVENAAAVYTVWIILSASLLRAQAIVHNRSQPIVAAHPNVIQMWIKM